MLEDNLRKIIRENLEVVLAFNGYERFEGAVDKQEFMKVIRRDPALAPFFLANEKYATVRIGGNLITSLHRKLGDIYEGIFEELLRDRLGVSQADLNFSVSLDVDGQAQRRSTDGALRLSVLGEQAQRRVRRLQSDRSAKGLGFEVRSCYQIGDSKRIQADRDLALALRRHGLEPVLLIFCATSLRSPVKRLAEYWTVREGTAAFAYVKELTGFDLAQFLKAEKRMIRELMERIFAMM